MKQTWSCLRTFALLFLLLGTLSPRFHLLIPSPPSRLHLDGTAHTRCTPKHTVRYHACPAPRTALPHPGAPPGCPPHPPCPSCTPTPVPPYPGLLLLLDSELNHFLTCHRSWFSVSGLASPLPQMHALHNHRCLGILVLLTCSRAIPLMSK